MRIRWHGHSCFEIEDEKTIVTDPHDGKSIGIRPPQAKGDIVLTSHDHFDHNAVRVVKKSNTEVVNEDGKFSYGPVDIEGFLTYHDEHDGDKRGENIVFKFKNDGLTFVHLGDLGHTLSGELIDKMGDVDFLFIPVGGTFTIGPKRAYEVIEAIKPNIAVPMHFKIGGLSLDIKEVRPFLEKYDDENIYKIGVELDFLKSDLPDETEIWVFSI